MNLIMKKSVLVSLFVGLFVSLTSCQKDDTSSLEQGSSSTSTLIVTIPQGIETKAAADYGHGDKINRCILEIYRDGELYGERQVAAVTGSQVTFSGLRLISSQTYDFVLWADCGDGTSDAYYNTSDLSAVTVNKAYTGNDDGFDAFYAKETYQVDGSFTKDITLQRPFGQLNVKTGDLASIPHEDLQPTHVQVSFQSIPTTFNVLTGEAGNPQSVTYTVPIEDASTGDLTVDYILATPEQAELADFSMTFLNGTTPIVTNDNFRNIPIRRNYRTNVSGNLVTKQGVLDIQVENGFSNDPIPWDGVSEKAPDRQLEMVEGILYEVHYIYEPAELAWEANPENITVEQRFIRLCGDIDMGGHPWTPISNYDRSESLGFRGGFDGQGYRILNLNCQNDKDGYGAGLIGVLNGGFVQNVTIENGTISNVYDCAGAICGVMLGSAKVEGCHSVNVNVQAGSAAGGIVGRAYGTSNEIRNCRNTSTVTGLEKCGGIVGIASNNGTTVIENCYNSGKVYGGNAGSAGILGYAGPTKNTISDCRNTGEIGTSQDKFAAGIVAYQASTEADGLIIQNCTNEGAIVGMDAGGIYGIPGASQPVMISSCTNTGLVTGSSRAGGIAARAGSGEITSCVNEGNVRAAMTDKGVAGGIVGDLGEAKINLCQGGGASADITAQYPGRLVGHVANKPYKPEDVEASLLIDDANGDDYTNIRTIGAMGLYTSWSNINIEQGTLHGFPAIDGQASGYVKIHTNASWDQYLGQTGVWYCRPDGQNQWIKEREL